MIPIDVLQSVYQIQYGEGSGSGFTIEYEHDKYLVTARHLFYSNETIKSYPRKTYDIPRATIQIFQNNKLKKLSGNVYFHENIFVDIAVIKLINTKLPFGFLKIDASGLSFGQDVYFLGYPYGLQSWLPYSTSPYPLPLIKKAIIAGFTTRGDGDSVLYLDTQANQGFSGGPIIFKYHGTDEFKVCGVMTAAFYTFIESQSTKISISVAEDNGITIVTHISHLEELIGSLGKRSI